MAAEVRLRTRADVFVQTPAYQVDISVTEHTANLYIGAVNSGAAMRKLTLVSRTTRLAFGGLAEV